MRLVLASTSAARRAMLTSAGIRFEAVSPAIDEETAKTRLLAKGATPLKTAEMLAAMKAVEVSEREPGLVIGADQTLDLDGELIGKAADLGEARHRLYQLRGRSHQLHSAVVVAESGQPVWRASDSATLSMRVFSEDFLDNYLERNGDRVLSSVGCYRLEGDGAQLFDAVEGDYFTILGMPLLPLLGFLRRRGAMTE